MRAPVSARAPRAALRGGGDGEDLVPVVLERRAGGRQGGGLAGAGGSGHQHQGVIAGQRRGGLDLGRVHLDTRGRGRPGQLVGAGVPARYGIGRATRGEPARRAGR